jgi:hypothetical protein
MDALARQLAGSKDANARALGAFGRIALGDADLADFLEDRDARVRRAAAMAVLANPSSEALAALLRRRALETDEATRSVLAIGLMNADPEGHVATSALIDRAESGGPDAPLAAMALARRPDPAHEGKVDALLRSRDPVMRAHVARGLGQGAAKNAVGRLAEAYAYEPSAAVRRAVVLALAARAGDKDSPSRRITLETASRLDPDATVRWTALRALSGHAAELRPSPLPLVAWIRVATAEGANPTAATSGNAAFSGALVRADGLAVPIAFDEDGYALVPGVPPAAASLVLAPRVPSYEADAK